MPRVLIPGREENLYLALQLSKQILKIVTDRKKKSFNEIMKRSVTGFEEIVVYRNISILTDVLIDIYQNIVDYTNK